MNLETKFWLAGLLEGEGSFCKPAPSSKGAPFISLQMTDEDVVAKVSQIFGVKYHQTKKKKQHHKQCFIVVKTGFEAIEIMKEIKPLMSQRRQQQIENAINSSTVQKRKIVSQKNIEEIYKLAKAGLKQTQIASKMKFRRETINRILNKKYGD